MEGVHDDRRPGAPGEQRGDAADRAGLRGVRVEDVRPLLADDPREAEGGEQVADRRDLPVQVRDRRHRHAEPVGDVGHRLLALATPPATSVVS